MKLNKLDITIGIDFARAADLMALFYSRTDRKQSLKLLTIRDQIIKVLACGKWPFKRGQSK